jgi:secreted Zn-dependent insulinase-like peptidase
MQYSLFIFFSFGSEPSMRQPSVPSPDEHEAMRRPAGDTRRYRVVQLDNGLEAVLVSDLRQEQGPAGAGGGGMGGGGGERTTAAVSMNVSAGNLQDPPEWRGLAHLLEHMILQV